MFLLEGGEGLEEFGQVNLRVAAGDQGFVWHFLQLLIHLLGLPHVFNANSLLTLQYFGSIVPVKDESVEAELVVQGLLRVLRSESRSGAGGADGSVAGEGNGQTSGPVLTGLVLTHQPARVVFFDVATDVE